LPIDTSEPLSDGWWIKRLARRLSDEYDRLDKLDSYYRGDPPLQLAAVEPTRRDTYKAFIKKARLNFAELVVDALAERLFPVGFLTGATTDELGDQEALELWHRIGLDIQFADLLQMLFTMSKSYAIVGFDDDDQQPIVTAEDPREVITEQDPARPQKTLAGLKLYHDDVHSLDLAYLYVPGKVRVASRERKAKTPGVNFNAASFDWDEERSRELPAQLANDVPVVEFLNKRGVGEFETHIDTLDRINHTVLQRVVITVMQAFRQRAAKNMPTVYPEGHAKAGEEIDYDGMFAADPGALWLLPEDAELWESAQADLSPILTSVKDDVTFLAAGTRTPVHYMAPGGENESASGADLRRETLTFKAKDRIKRVDPRAGRVMQLCFKWLDDADRAKQVKVLWAPPDRMSLTEKAAAATQAQASGVPWETIMTDIWEFPPDKVALMRSQRADDQLYAAQVAAAAQAAAPAKPPAPPAAGQ
jgi:hypothetical protein